jgi:hypothetical protein
VAERYQARVRTTLDNELHTRPANVRAGPHSYLGPPPMIPFDVQLFDVEPGAELSFVDELRSAYLTQVLLHPELASTLAGDPNLVLAAAPNWRLHASAVAEAVPAPFTLGPHHSGYLSTIGLAGVGSSAASGITVAVLDNGFDDQFWQGAPAPIPVSCGHDLIDLIPGDDSTSGHGTLVAAVVASSAPGANVVPVRMAGQHSTEWDTLHALARAVQINADVVTNTYRQNLKDRPSDTCGLVRQAARSEVFAKLLDWASDRGTRAILVAAGNGGAPEIARPAAYPRAIPVTALDHAGTALAAFSNWDARGRLLVLALPGEDIASSPTSGTSYHGTSFATGYAAALYAVAMKQWSRTDAPYVTSTLVGSGFTVPHATVPVLN